MRPVTPDCLDVPAAAHRCRPRGGIRVGEYGVAVRDRGIREQTQAGQAVIGSKDLEPVLVRSSLRVSTWPVQLTPMHCGRESVLSLPACSPSDRSIEERQSGGTQDPRVRAERGVGGRSGAPG